MLDINEKIEYLGNYLSDTPHNYADSFKVDILFRLEPLEIPNPSLGFLDQLESFEEIESWVNRLTSRIVLKFDEESEQISEFIDDYVENG